MKLIQLLLIALLFVACNKSSADFFQKSSSLQSNEFTHYIIKQGAHFVANNQYKSIELPELKFIVKFDSSAIYKTVNPINQYDINKLYGFSDNNAMHHDYSARFGWSWNEDALRIYAYVYNDGVVCKKELKAVDIGASYQCSIKAEENRYLFIIDGEQTSLPRTSTTSIAKGYLLFPYFGGDEAAPHDIHIQIKDL